MLPGSVSASGQGGAAPCVGSDEGNSHRDAGGLRPLGRVMAHQVLHHRVFGHVLHQVGLRGVGPPAHAAAVGLGMLDGMGREVDLQGGGVRVGPVAVGTLVGLVLVVLALVRLEVGELSESLFAARMWALVGSVACVDSGMLLEVGELSEGLITVGAVVGLDAQVDAQVLGQVGGVGKGFGAVRALVGLGLCVRLGVDLHLRLGEKGQRAYLTPVRLALLGSLARGQDGVGDYEDRRPPWILRFDLFSAALGLGGAKQAVALDCLDGVQEGGAGDP